MQKNLFIFFIALLLTACSVFPQPTTTITRYTISYPKVKKYIGNRENNIVIEQPQLHSTLQTNRIVFFLENNNILEYLAKVEWAEKLDTMVRETITYAIEDLNLFKNVYQLNPESYDSYLQMKIYIKDFNLKLKNGKKYLSVEYHIKILKLGAIIFEKTFGCEIGQDWDNVDQFIKSLNKCHHNCINKLLAELVEKRKQKIL